MRTRQGIINYIEKRIKELEATGGPFRLPSPTNMAKLEELRALLKFAASNPV